MFDDRDRAYFARRAMECREKERDAVDLAIGRIHRAIAEECERRAQGEPAQKVPRL